MNGPDPPDELSPAERSLDRHLELLRADPPTPSTELVARVIHAARWQRALRHPLLAVSAIAGVIRDGMLLLFGASPRR